MTESSLPTESEVLLRMHGRVAELTLHRPQRANAISIGMVADLHAAMDALDRDHDVRAVVLTGSGDRSFCAGADLVQRQQMTIDQVQEFLHDLNAVIARLDAFRAPVIAAIGGAARGGGLELALACDVRWAAETATFALPEVTLGIIPGAGGTQRLAHAVGPARAKELLITGRIVGIDEAERIGLVHGRCPSGSDVRAFALQYAAQHFERGAPIAIEAALNAVDAAWGRPAPEGLAVERQCYERTLQSRDRVEALQAFAQKRSPRFTGN
jgi:methylglutaconyl-CoA hydratase